MHTTFEKIQFPSINGKQLSARLEKPNTKPHAYCLFAHCFTCGKDIAAAARIAKSLAENAIAVLRFDFTGLGSSQGEFSNSNFSSNIQDLEMAANFMRNNYQAPSLLIGHSLGGTAALAVANKIPELKAIVTISSPFNASHVGKLFKDKKDEIISSGHANVCLAGRNFKIKKQFLDDIKSKNITNEIKNLKKALLILHAPNDSIVSIDNATKIFTTAIHPKSFISLDNADHLISNKNDAIYTANVITAWVNRYI